MFKPGDKVRVIKSKFSKSYYPNCKNFSSGLDESKTYVVNQIYYATTVEKDQQYFSVVGEMHNHPHDIFELVYEHYISSNLQKPNLQKPRVIDL